MDIKTRDGIFFILDYEYLKVSPKFNHMPLQSSLNLYIFTSGNSFSIQIDYQKGYQPNLTPYFFL